MSECLAKLNDAGYIAAASSQATMIIALGVADAAIMAGQSLYERFASSSISNMQIEIADRQMKLAEHFFEHEKSFWPAEKDLVNFTFSEPYYNEEPYYNYLFDSYAVDDSSSILTCWMNDTVIEEVAFTEEQYIRFETKIAQERVDASSYGMRQDEAKKDALNERRYSRRSSVLQLGRGLASRTPYYYGVANASRISAGGILSGNISRLGRIAGQIYGEDIETLNWKYFKNGTPGFAQGFQNPATHTSSDVQYQKMLKELGSNQSNNSNSTSDPESGGVY